MLRLRFWFVPQDYICTVNAHANHCSTVCDHLSTSRLAHVPVLGVRIVRQYACTPKIMQLLTTCRHVELLSGTQVLEILKVSLTFTSRDSS
jgi:hypothetical protein